MSEIPMRPIFIDDANRPAFKGNAVIQYLVRSGKLNMVQAVEKIADKSLPQEDIDEFYQLVGYSIGGYCEIKFVSDESCEKALAIAERLVNPAPTN